VRTFRLLRALAVFLAWTAAGLATPLFIANVIVQHSLQGAEPDGFLLFFKLFAYLVPAGALIGAILGFYNVRRLHKQNHAGR